MATEAVIALITNEGSRFYISTRIIDFSGYIKDKVEDLEFEEIPVDISPPILMKIKEFFEHHEYKEIKSLRKTIKSSNFATLTSEWDYAFFKSFSDDDIADFISAANSLQCEALFELGCAFIATQFKEQTLDEVKVKFDITEDLTPEIEEGLKNEYSFIFKDLSTEAQSNVQ